MLPLGQPNPSRTLQTGSQTQGMFLAWNAAGRAPWCAHSQPQTPENERYLPSLPSARASSQTSHEEEEATRMSCAPPAPASLPVLDLSPPPSAIFLLSAPQAPIPPSHKPIAPVAGGCCWRLEQESSVSSRQGLLALPRSWTMSQDTRKQPEPQKQQTPLSPGAQGHGWDSCP